MRDERTLGEAARAYVMEWVVQARRVEAVPSGRRDRYNRMVARIEIDGVDLGDRLMARGLAQRWRGRKADFCRAPSSVPAAR